MGNRLVKRVGAVGNALSAFSKEPVDPFWGSTAPGCPQRRVFYSQTEYNYGGSPSIDDAFNWLRGVW